MLPGDLVAAIDHLVGKRLLRLLESPRRKER